MSTEDNLFYYPSATLLVAYDASKKREEGEKFHREREEFEKEKEEFKKEKEEFRKEIRGMRERLDELEKRFGKQVDAAEIESEEGVMGKVKRKAKRLRVDSPSDDETLGEYSRRSIAKVRKDSKAVSPQSSSCTMCRRRRLRCEWDESSNSRCCLACRRSKSGCDLKRPIPTDSGAFTREKLGSDK